MKHVSYSAPEMTEEMIETKLTWKGFTLSDHFHHGRDWCLTLEVLEARVRLGRPEGIEQKQAFENFKALKRLTQ